MGELEEDREGKAYSLMTASFPEIRFNENLKNHTFNPPAPPL